MSSLSPECSGEHSRTECLSALAFCLHSLAHSGNPHGLLALIHVRDARVNMIAPTACHWSWLTRR